MAERVRRRASAGSHATGSRPASCAPDRPHRTQALENFTKHEMRVL
jgi:hypothetical protein